MNVTVVGAGGHVGLPLSLVLADAGHHVFGLDINAEGNKMIMQGCMPFVEDQGEELLASVLMSKRLDMTHDPSVIGKSDVVIVIIGTPIDENLNPRVDHLLRFFESAKPYLKDQLVILRSTVSPGTTDAVKKVLGINGESKLDIVFGPERVLQGKSIEEIKSLPQIIGAYSEETYNRAAEFFRTFIHGETFHLTPIEAELGKLITNMARYVGFALANEFHLICDTFGANACRVIDACNKDYPRLNLPVPGPNVGGPCLYKDGWYLIERIPFNDLISSAFRINEGMCMQIIQNLERRIGTGKRVGVLGMTFKADNDDTRNSLSFKLRRQLAFRGFEAVCVEPHVEGFAPMEEMAGVDAVVLMTPHKEFKDLQSLLGTVNNPECLFVDLWGFWREMRHRSQNGYFLAKEVNNA
ncbi:MAG TPA: nucleotide sugar dehydrogenase [Fimbriimonadaceae bacterium]|nr:nucleotide sugar dehydrogenase [Fimbriimonadaceae bacterium]